jgi:putative exosortase-associated protein (TIGR04073 family)
MMKKEGLEMAKKILICLMILAVVAPNVYAFEPSPWKSESTYGAKAKAKLGYGLTNFLLGWTEIFTEIYEAGSEGGNILSGFGTGMWNALGDTVGGVLHAATFPCPWIDLPLPEGGTDVLK